MTQSFTNIQLVHIIKKTSQVKNLKMNPVTGNKRKIDDFVEAFEEAAGKGQNVKKTYLPFAKIPTTKVFDLINIREMAFDGKKCIGCDLGEDHYIVFPHHIQKKLLDDKADPNTSLKEKLDILNSRKYLFVYLGNYRFKVEATAGKEYDVVYRNMMTYTDFEFYEAQDPFDFSQSQFGGNTSGEAGGSVSGDTASKKKQKKQ